ncbi:MAG: FAD-dependent oxidoreductase [Geminicoccaceae bacterium]
MPDYDLAVIGSGASGLPVTAAAAQLGLSVALIERGRMGGDCLNYGCVPSKALLAAAHAAQAARGAGRYGVKVAVTGIDWERVRAHVQGAIAAIAPNDSEERYRALGASVFRDHARFVSPDALEVGGRRITARRFVVAAGSRAAIPTIPGLDRVPYLTNANLFELRERPAHLLILGGGPIGLEMAQAYAGLGCQVTVIEAGSIAAKEDPELVNGLKRVLGEQGVVVLEHTSVEAIRPGPVLVLKDGTTVSGSHLLVAAGRQPNLEDLGLEAARVRAGWAVM